MSPAAMYSLAFSTISQKAARLMLDDIRGVCGARPPRAWAMKELLSRRDTAWDKVAPACS